MDENMADKRSPVNEMSTQADISVRKRKIQSIERSTGDKNRFKLSGVKVEVESIHHIDRRSKRDCKVDQKHDNGLPSITSRRTPELASEGPNDSVTPSIKSRKFSANFPMTN